MIPLSSSVGLPISWQKRRDEMQMNWNSIVMTQKNIPALCFAGFVSIRVSCLGSPGCMTPQNSPQLVDSLASHIRQDILHAPERRGVCLLPFADIGFRLLFMGLQALCVLIHCSHYSPRW